MKFWKLESLHQHMAMHLKKASGSNIHNSEKMNEESYLDKETYKFIAIKPLDCDVYVPNIVTSNMG